MPEEAAFVPRNIAKVRSGTGFLGESVPLIHVFRCASISCSHVVRLAAVLYVRRVKKSCLKKLHTFVCLILHFSKESKGFKPKQVMDLFWIPGTF